MNSHVTKTIQYTIYNVTGQIIVNNTIEIGQGITETAIDIAEFPAGYYLIDIHDGAKSEKIKLTKL